jgi:flagellar biogenesis protein FliO
MTAAGTVAAQKAQPIEITSVRDEPREVGKARGLPQAVSVIASLGIVLGLFFLVAWLFRKAQPKSVPRLPPDIVEVLGRTPLVGRHHAHLIRFGNKLVLLSATPGGIEPLAEITDPDEVIKVQGACLAARPDSATQTFRRVLSQVAGEKS